MDNLARENAVRGPNALLRYNLCFPAVVFAFELFGQRHKVADRGAA